MDFTLKRRRKMRSVRVRVEPTGDVMVTAPFGVPKSYIMSFVMQQSTWISRQKEKIKLRSDIYPVLDWERHIASYLGNLFTIRFDPKIDDRVKVGKSFIYVNPITGLESHVRRTFLRWLKQNAETYITKRLLLWNEKMSTTYSSVSFRQQKSRWGSCGPQNELSFNWRLIHFKPEVIDYVVIHELAHTKHHDHSARFWNVVEAHDPSYPAKSYISKEAESGVGEDLNLLPGYAWLPLYVKRICLKCPFN
jgi:predicted metal-dependent hydrolase